MGHFHAPTYLIVPHLSEPQISRDLPIYCFFPVIHAFSWFTQRAQSSYLFRKRPPDLAAQYGQANGAKFKEENGRERLNSAPPSFAVKNCFGGDKGTT